MTARFPDHHLGWRVLAGFAVGFALVQLATVAWGVASTYVTRLLPLDPLADALIGSTVRRGVGAVLWVASWAIITRLVLKRRLKDLAFRRHAGWQLDLLIGVALATLAMAVVFALELASGWLAIEGWMWQRAALGEWLARLWRALLSSAAVAVVEEVVFRGYLFTGLKEAWGKGVGLAVMAVVFAPLHLLSSGIRQHSWPMVLLVISLAAVVFGWAYLRTGSLWLVIGMHFGWDLVQLDLLNLMGDPPGEMLFGAITRFRGGDWLLGLMDLLAMAILCGGIWLRTRRREAG